VCSNIYAFCYRGVQADAAVQGHGQKGHEKLEGVEVPVVLALIYICRSIKMDGEGWRRKEGKTGQRGRHVAIQKGGKEKDSEEPKEMRSSTGSL